MTILPILTVSAAILLSGCAGSFRAPSAAEALLGPTEGSATTGNVVFVQKDGDVEVTAHLTGLGPGAHRLRMAEQGGCELPSAGGRELPLPETDPWSNASARAVLAGLTLAEILGKAVFVEARPAAPLACGVIVRR